MATQARALFDFESGGPGELSFNADDIITIIRQDVGAGWWEARKMNTGEGGLVPESYLEIISRQEPSLPPPLPPLNTKPKSFHQPQIYSPSNNTVDDWDDEWDDDDSSSTTTEQQDTNTDYRSSRGFSDDKKSSAINIFSRLSNFSKNGIEAYLFSDLKDNSNKIYEIIETAEGPFWKPLDEPYNVVVASPKKESKFKGIKSFIAYQITPSFSNIQVSRRYKHFDWLLGRLLEHLPTSTIPPLPEKQISGRFEDDFVLQRLHHLQTWMDRMTKHPVVSRSPVFLHFVSCTDTKAWKMGKRKAEKEENLGGAFFATVKLPDHPLLDNKQAEQRIDKFNRFIRSFDDSVKSLSVVSENSVKRHVGPLKKEYERLGCSFLSLSKSFEYDQRPAATTLTRAVEHTGNTYNDIGHLFAKQPEKDMLTLLEGLHEYKGLLSTIPHSLNIYKSAQAKIQEMTTKMNSLDLQKVQERSEVISYSVLADIEHFERYWVNDFNSYMREFLKEQISFYLQIASKLEDSLKQYQQ